MVMVREQYGPGGASLRRVANGNGLALHTPHRPHEGGARVSDGV